MKNWQRVFLCFAMGIAGAAVPAMADNSTSVRESIEKQCQELTEETGIEHIYAKGILTKSWLHFPPTCGVPVSGHTTKLPPHCIDPKLTFTLELNLDNGTSARFTSEPLPVNMLNSLPEFKNDNIYEFCYKSIHQDQKEKFIITDLETLQLVKE